MPSPIPLKIALAGAHTDSALLEAIVPAVIAASVAIVAAVLTPALSDLQRRRSDLHSRFDRAIASLLTVQAARHIASSITRGYHPGTDAEYRLFNVSMAENSIRGFVAETVKAREALSHLAQYVPEVRQWITTGWELTEENEPAQRATIERRRRDAIRSERLFRDRRISTPLDGEA